MDATMAPRTTDAQPIVFALLESFIFLFPFVLREKYMEQMPIWPRPAGLGDQGHFYTDVRPASAGRSGCPVPSPSGEPDGTPANVNANVNGRPQTLIKYEDFIKGVLTGAPPPRSETAGEQPWAL
jgi:hypothetical protein